MQERKESIDVYLTGEADADTEQNATNNEHGHTLGRAVDGRTDKEGKTAEDHGRLSPKRSSDGRRKERGNESGEIERRCKRRQALAIKFTVLILVLISFHLPIHRREETHQKWVHGCHST